MAAAQQLETARLRLRRWRPQDEAAMGPINADPEVTRYLNRRVDAAATAEFYARCVEHWEEHGFGFWGLELRGRGRGLATEAAAAARDHTFDALELPELISIIHPDDARSRRVAAKLGMTLTEHVHVPVLDRDADVWTLGAPG